MRYREDVKGTWKIKYNKVKKKSEIMVGMVYSGEEEGSSRRLLGVLMELDVGEGIAVLRTKDSKKVKVKENSLKLIGF